MNHYFVYDCYTASGRPKAEDAVMQYARDKYMYCLLADYMLEDVQMDLERYCMKIREENRRLSGVNINVSEERYEFQGRDAFVREHSLDMEKEYTVRYFLDITKWSYGGRVMVQLLDAYGAD